MGVAEVRRAAAGSAGVRHRSRKDAHRHAAQKTEGEKGAAGDGRGAPPELG